MPDHYEILGLHPRATGAEIKAAYRSLVRQLHPDLQSGGEGGATERLLDVQRAYEVLSHPGRRASYDAGVSEGLDGVLGDRSVAEALEEVLIMVRERPEESRREWLDGSDEGWTETAREEGPDPDLLDRIARAGTSSAPTRLEDEDGALIAGDGVRVGDGVGAGDGRRAGIVSGGQGGTAGGPLGAGGTARTGRAVRGRGGVATGGGSMTRRGVAAWDRLGARESSPPNRPRHGLRSVDRRLDQEEDRFFLVGVGASVMLAGVAGAVVFRTLAGPGGLVQLLTFLLVATLAPLLALLASWVLSYADGRMEAALQRAARRLRTGTEPAGRASPSPTTPTAAEPSEEALSGRAGGAVQALVLLAVSVPHVLVTAGMTAGGTADLPGLLLLPAAVVSGVAFAVLHRVRLAPARRRLFLIGNLAAAGATVWMAVGTWRDSFVAATSVDLAASFGVPLGMGPAGFAAGVVGALLLVAVLYAAADLWHRLVDGWGGRRERDGAGVGRISGAALRGVVRLLANLLDGLAAALRVCSLPGTFIRRAIGGGWL